MHVRAYNKHTGADIGRNSKIRPPFYCPWAGEGCDWPPCYNQKEHQQHIWKVHDKPGMLARGIKPTLAGHEEDEK